MERETKPCTYKGETNNRDMPGINIRQLQGEGNERKFELSFSSEEPVERYWGPEILENTEAAVDLTRLNSLGVVLYNHERNQVIGKIEKAWIEGNRGKAIIEFDTDEKSEVIYQKVKGGTLKGVSVSYRVKLWEEVQANKKSIDERFTGPCSIAKKWEPTEISIVSVPADPTVGVGRSEKSENEKIKLAIYEKQVMINKNK